MSQVNTAVRAQPDNPGLPFKPPLPFLAAMVVGAGLHHLRPIRVRPVGWAPLGIVIVLLAVLVLLWAMAAFRRKRTPLEPWKATRAIVDDGPFAFSRNPVYIAFAMVEVGVGLWSDKLAVVALVIVPVVLIATMVVPREEEYLRRKFGAEYLAYCARVRRWV